MLVRESQYVMTASLVSITAMNAMNTLSDAARMKNSNQALNQYHVYQGRNKARGEHVL